MQIRTMSEKTKRQIITEVKNGRRIIEIARMFTLSPATVYKLLYIEHIDLTSGYERRLNNKIKYNIIEDYYINGLSINQLNQKYTIKPPIIRYLINKYKLEIYQLGAKELLKTSEFLPLE